VKERATHVTALDAARLAGLVDLYGRDATVKCVMALTAEKRGPKKKHPVARAFSRWCRAQIRLRAQQERGSRRSLRGARVLAAEQMQISEKSVRDACAAIEALHPVFRDSAVGLMKMALFMKRRDPSADLDQIIEKHGHMLEEDVECGVDAAVEALHRFEADIAAAEERARLGGLDAAVEVREARLRFEAEAKERALLAGK
jgi:hypothetical protein